MTTPLPITESFCDLLLNTKWLKLTPARKTVIQETRQAAIDQTPLTDTQWSNFLLVAKDFYIVWQVQTNFATP